MKDINSSPSNSKSEDTPLIKDYMGNVVGATEPPQDTSLDAQLRVSINNIMIEFLGMEGKPTMDEAIHQTKLKFLELFKSKQVKLLQVVEDEVVGADDEAGQDHLLSERVGTIRNTLKAEQRQVLKKLKDNVINGGSL